jgi:hypothetical protein
MTPDQKKSLIRSNILIIPIWMVSPNACSTNTKLPTSINESGLHFYNMPTAFLSANDCKRQKYDLSYLFGCSSCFQPYLFHSKTTVRFDAYMYVPVNSKCNLWFSQKIGLTVWILWLHSAQMLDNHTCTCSSTIIHVPVARLLEWLHFFNQIQTNNAILL